MARLLSVNVGLPRDIEWKGRIVHTAIWKDPVRGRCGVRRLNLDGDGQGDLAGHGGEQRAVFVYQIESYRYWQEQLKRTDFVYGQFGENFTIEGLADVVRRAGHRRLPIQPSFVDPLGSTASLPTCRVLRKLPSREGSMETKHDSLEMIGLGH